MYIRYIHTNMNIDVCFDVNVCRYINTSIHHVYVYTNIHVCTYTYIYVNIYMYIELCA